MVKNKLSIDEFFSDDFELIAIFTTIEDFRLAYFLNKNLPILLKKNNQNISISTKKGEGEFSWFIYEDEKLDQIWNLVQNRTQIINDTNFGLFLDDAITQNLLPEMPKVDYILKVENIENSFNINDIINKITHIEAVTLCYKIDINNVKSINNLIF